MSPTLRPLALAVLQEPDPGRKAALASRLPDAPVGDASQVLAPTATIPGRPARPVLVPANAVPQRSLGSVEGRAALVHALAHIELNAVDLAADAIWRFPDLPEAFYREWAQVAREEALHFELLRSHLRSLGFDYGDFPAHHGLWEMAEKTKGDLLARLALVPRTLEARGLDASPLVKRKLVGAGDHRAGEILDIILRDEIGHVAIGNRWYRHVCDARGLDPIGTYEDLARRHDAPKPRGPFNLEARRAAGFEEEELEALRR